VLHADLTGKILEAGFEVINEPGAGFLESVSEKALLAALRQKGLEAHAQVPLKVTFRGVDVGEFFADLLVKNQVIVELKAHQTIMPDHQAQLINYLQAAGIEVGLLINCGRQKLELRRLHRGRSQ
jgi:GxxExxY protein